jgi:hypothetical protein
MKILAVQRIALAAMAIIASAPQGGAFAQECRTNYYPCSLNAGGRIDPGNPAAAEAWRRVLQTAVPAISINAT